MLTEAMQKELEEERKIQRLNTVLVNKMHELVEAGEVKEVPKGHDTEMKFDMECIPEELRNLFRERLPVLWGEISDDAPLEQKKYFYTHGFKVDGNNVRVRLMRNW